MARQTLAERIATAFLEELHAQGICAEPLELTDHDFEHLALKVQEHLDDAAASIKGLLNGGNGEKEHTAGGRHLRRRRDSGAPQERGEPRAERRGKHR